MYNKYYKDLISTFKSTLKRHKIVYIICMKLFHLLYFTPHQYIKIF